MQRPINSAPKKSKRDAASPTAKTKAAPTAEVRKADVILNLLARPRGASIPELTKATGWQAHSIRGFLSGQIKKKRQLTLLSERIDGVLRHRLPKKA